MMLKKKKKKLAKLIGSINILMLRKKREKRNAFQKVILESLSSIYLTNGSETQTFQSGTTKSPCISNFHTVQA